jgi:benzodiazapine receptor
MKNFLKFLFSLFICFSPAVIGGLVTAKNICPWYDTLSKPSFTPPNWVFSPAWTILYTLMAISLFFVLKTANSKDKTYGLVFFAIQLFLNGLWSVLFFGLHSILGALANIILLLLFIILTMLKFYKISKPAFYLLIPYLLWVSFATALNFAVFILNKPI